MARNGRQNPGDPLLDDATPIPLIGAAPDEQKAIYEAALKRQLAKKAATPPPPQSVVVTDVDIRFWSMVRLLVKLAFAGIPAMLIVALIVYGFASILGLIFLPFGRH